MRITYSAPADSLDIELVPGATSAETREIGLEVYADFDRQGRLLAIEILGARRFYARAQLDRLAAPVETLTLAEAAKEGGLSPTTLRLQISHGRLPAVKRGRDWVVTRHDLWNYLDNRAPQGRPGRVPRSGVRPKARTSGRT